MSSDESAISLEALEREEARLRERLSKIAVVKELLRDLAIPPNASPLLPQPQPQPQPVTWSPPEPKNDAFPWAFDGTFKGLIDSYRSHGKSPYHRLKHNVRSNYDHVLDRLVKEIGSERVSAWSAERIKDEYDRNWSAHGKIAMGRTMAGKVRLLTSFGSTVLNDDASMRLSAILGNMKFPTSLNAKNSRERLTIDHVRAIRALAHQHFNWPSIALAQALQFELPKIRQMDVIGEWVPIGDPGTSDITKGDEKWLHGLRWSDIDENMVLRRVLTTGRKDQHRAVEYNLKRFQMTIEEINKIPPWRRNGALVVCEFSNLPWTGAEYRRKWRIVADKAGVPASIKSTDGPRALAAGNEGEPELGAETAL